jgi:AraC family transcriptional regulator
MTASADDPSSQMHDTISSVPGFHIEKTRSWGLISAHVVSRDAGQGVWQGEHHQIHYVLTDMHGTVQVNGGRERPVKLPRGSLAFAPSGMSIRSNLAAGRFIQILQNPDTYDTIISDIVRGGTAHLESQGVFSDPLISRMVSTIADEMEGGFLDRVLVDALNTALAVQITRRFVDPSAITLAPSSGLSPERLQRVRDYVEAHLDDRLTLTDMAGVACLSPYHFSRSFKEAAGVGTQRYVLQRRVERAKRLMRQTHQPLALIALEAGFADQSHFTIAFRREVGVTPGRFRGALA